ncbi:hypothetical protein SUDANB1_07140 [Streptomyces sp. enrichment culture]|uniref:hypothetical protein n=1 Tax=Streptomyces sp. enrichment culture TaxID=1795815 RepID=UPI003F5519A2
MINIEAILIGLFSVAHTPEQAEHAARTVLRDHAHQLAELQRHHFGIGNAPVRAHCDPDCDFCQGVTSAADLIDPEVKP